jgi:isopenicillin N synthase-like dioxygenase
MDVSRNAGWEKLAQIRPSTGVADLKESMQLGFHNMEDLWPSLEDSPTFRPLGEKFMAQCNEVSIKLLTCLAIGLGFEDDFFTKSHDVTKSDNLNTLRFLHYHDITGQVFPPEYWRAGAHTDFDTLTLLFQRPGENGLEVCPGREASTEFGHGDQWTPVSPDEGDIVCNIGDMIMRWSDDRLKSNFHRVRAPKVGEYQGPRYSIAYFNQANKSAVIQGVSRYTEPITAGDFIKQAMERNYSALKELKEKQAKAAAVVA